MVRIKTKWKYFVLINLLMLSVFVRSLPIETHLPTLTVVDTSFAENELPQIPLGGPKPNDYEEPATTESATEPATHTDRKPDDEIIISSTASILPLPEENIAGSNVTTLKNGTRSLFRNVRPGQDAWRYAIEITPNGNNFIGRAVINVLLTSATMEDPIEFHVEDLNIEAVRTGIFSPVNAIDADFGVDDGILEIEPQQDAANFVVVVEYTGSFQNGFGLYRGEYENGDYLAMNLHATNARRVFPCMDELDKATNITFTFNDLPYNHVFMNSAAEDIAPTQFRALIGPPMLWGMMAHNFNNIINPITNVHLHVRQGIPTGQDNQASLAFNSYFRDMEEWTDKPYTGIVLDQDGRMNVLALPDVHRDWYALSTVCIWEPYVMMERIHSVTQRKEALNEMAEAVARQWFGYVIRPENWMHQWVVQGLAGYTASELNKNFQTSDNDDITLLDYNTIFTTDVIQEALYRDSYDCAQPLQPDGELFDEDAIREHIYNLKIIKYKAPALMRMLRLVLGDEEQDFVMDAGRILLNSRSLDTVNTRFFLDAINAGWIPNGNDIIDDVAEFLENWIGLNGYPVLQVGLRSNGAAGVLLTQEKFSYGETDQTDFPIPITWTTSIAPNYGDDNIRPSAMLESTMILNTPLGEDDYMLFNIQGQGYYRVNYDSGLWERIIAALEDPEQREQIHPLNRATLVDDALNLARAGRLDYDTAFQVVLTMEHEVHYAPWKAFVRNMDFLRKRLVAYYLDDDDRDPDIYLRMVRRTIGRVENELSFYPDINTNEDAMDAMTRGLVMDHACKAGYRPCVAAAIDWFWDPNDPEVVNPNIPHEIRPAVFCTMVREGGNDIINALYERLEIEPVMYERVVILESLACSQDNGFILTLLTETIATNGPYSVEERNRIFKAVAESSYDNALIAVNFISQRTADMRRMYGGPEKLEDVIWHLAENLADAGHRTDFHIWVNSINSDLDNSEMAAIRARELVDENLRWNDRDLENVYEWIEENDAPRIVVSLFLICGSFVLAIFNR